MKTKFFIDSFNNIIFGKINASITKEDLYNSKYISLYNHHRRKRDYKESLEKTTLNKLNEVLKAEFPRKLKKEAISEIVDCTVMFLKWITVNYDYFPNETVYNSEFNRIINKNIERFKNN